MEEQTGMRREREEGSSHTQLTSLGLSIMSGGHLESLFRGNQKQAKEVPTTSPNLSNQNLIFLN